MCRGGCRALLGGILIWGWPVLGGSQTSGGAWFVDWADSAGLVGANTSGTDQTYIVEGMMGGAAFFDYDGDGDVDLYATNGARFDGFAGQQPPRNWLYRNEGGLFTEVGHAAGVADTSWSMGSTPADYDNDGDIDLYVANFGRNTLYRNDGDGTFEDITGVAGTGNQSWGTGCTFGDYDRDGDVDLYVANYVDFSRDYQSPIPCLWKNVGVYCGPVGLLPAADVFYQNKGDGTFVDYTEEAGLAGFQYYGMSALFGDIDDDGWADIFVADDSTPNLLFHNQGNGTFAETALLAGVAYSGEGVKQGCMGAAMGDYDGDGRTDILVTNFADEHNTLYRNDGDGFFTDRSFGSRLTAAGAAQVAWGTSFFDFDNDGDKDIFVANGHTYPQADLPQVNSSYREANFLFENDGGGLFREVGQQAGPGLALEQVSRGTSTADYDDDGDLDIFILNLNDRPNLLRNEGTNGNHYLSVRTIGSRSNRDGIGTRIAVSAGGRTQYGEVRSGSSYLSHDDLRVHFGLGAATQVDSLELRWPSGVVQVLRQVDVDQVLTVREPDGPSSP